LKVNRGKFEKLNEPFISKSG